MKASTTKLCCAVALCAVIVVLMGQVPATEAVTCNYLELVSCAPAITSPQPASSTCCNKVREQRPCLCGYLRNPALSQYVTRAGAQKVASQCGVSIPNC